MKIMPFGDVKFLGGELWTKMVLGHLQWVTRIGIGSFAPGIAADGQGLEVYPAERSEDARIARPAGGAQKRPYPLQMA